MRKIVTMTALALSLGTFAQQAYLSQQKFASPGPAQKKALPTSKVAGGIVNGRFDPGLSVLAYRGQATMSAGVDANNIGTYVAPVYMDSTVRISFASGGTSYVDRCMLGAMFDPQSSVFDPFLVDPLFSNTDTYYLDTVWIGGYYKPMPGNTVTDTLLVQIAWGDTSSATVFKRWSFSAAPIKSFGPYCTPLYAGNAAHGQKGGLTAPSTNMITIRRPITPNDTFDLGANGTGYIAIPINATQIGALTGTNKIGVVYTFVPGTAVPADAVVYNGGGSGPDPQTANGFAGYQYAQKTPPINAVTDYQNYFDDPDRGKNVGMSVSNSSRYGVGGWSNQVYGEPASSYWIDFSVHGSSTVGIKDHENSILALGQNQPNPAVNETTIRYALKAAAKKVQFNVVDVTGRVVYAEVLGSQAAGSYNLNLQVKGFAPGVYYYSLEVDGAASTRKLIVQ